MTKTTKQSTKGYTYEELQLRRWAENAAELAMATREVAISRQLGQFIR